MQENYIELNTFIKINNLAGTGGEAKNIIRSGVVKVDDVTETRNKRKLYPGMIVEIDGKKLEVKKEIIKS